MPMLSVNKHKASRSHAFDMKCASFIAEVCSIYTPCYFRMNPVCGSKSGNYRKRNVFDRHDIIWRWGWCVMTEGCMRAWHAHTENPPRRIHLFNVKSCSHLDKLLPHVWTMAVSQSGPSFDSITQSMFSEEIMWRSHVSPGPQMWPFAKTKKEQIILWELFCLKPLERPKQTAGDKREWWDPG